LITRSELRATLPLLAVPSDKPRHYRDRLRPLFDVISHTRLRRRVAVNASVARNLVLMGPSARRLSDRDVVLPQGTRCVTFDVELMLARRV
jgi:hypothetical protein